MGEMYCDCNHYTITMKNFAQARAMMLCISNNIIISTAFLRGVNNAGDGEIYLS